MVDNKDILLTNKDKIHTTKLGIERIVKNLKLNCDDVVEYIKNKILDKECIIYKKGKNYYCEIDNIIITINSYNFCIITAHVKKKMFMKKKLILFDWGNIVESFTTGYTCRDAFADLFHECGYNGDKVIFKELSKYKITRIKNSDEFREVYKEMKKEFNLNKSYEEFVTLYKKIFDKIDYYKEVADYEVSLKDRCSIGILSNLTIFDKERLDKQVNLSNYDYTFLSFEFGLRKPEIEFYEKIQSMVPFKPEDILFIDDRKDNVEIALKIGWNAFQLTGLELDEIKQKCEEFLTKGVEWDE